MNEIVDIINNVGVVVTVLGASMWFIYYTFNKHREDLQEQRDMYQKLLVEEQTRHDEEVKAMTEAINNNTIALTKLYEIMSRGEDNE